MVEFAFVAPVFFLLLFGIFEYARFLFVMQTLNNAAREGARYAVVNATSASTANVQTYVDGYLAGQGYGQLAGYSPGNNIAVFQADPVTGQDNGQGWQNARWGTLIGVRIQGTYNSMVPGLTRLTGPMNVQATCIMTSETN